MDGILKIPWVKPPQALSEAHWEDCHKLASSVTLVQKALCHTVNLQGLTFKDCDGIPWSFHSLTRHRLDLHTFLWQFSSVASSLNQSLDEQNCFSSVPVCHEHLNLHIKLQQLVALLSSATEEHSKSSFLISALIGAIFWCMLSIFLLILR